MALCFTGVVTIAVYKNNSAASSLGFSEELMGITAIFVMSWLYATGNVLSRKLK
jgi:hypothetical protein